MEQLKIKEQAAENVIFDSLVIGDKAVLVQETYKDIMDIPGTPHEKLVKLSEMI